MPVGAFSRLKDSCPKINSLIMARDDGGKSADLACDNYREGFLNMRFLIHAVGPQNATPDPPATLHAPDWPGLAAAGLGGPRAGRAGLAAPSQAGPARQSLAGWWPRWPSLAWLAHPHDTRLARAAGTRRGPWPRGACGRSQRLRRGEGGAPRRTPCVAHRAGRWRGRPLCCAGMHRQSTTHAAP